jgi:hypothetical protein
MWAEGLGHLKIFRNPLEIKPSTSCLVAQCLNCATIHSATDWDKRKICVSVEKLREMNAFDNFVDVTDS